MCLFSTESGGGYDPTLGVVPTPDPENIGLFMESRREARNPKKPEACMAWARGGYMGAKSRKVGRGRVGLALQEMGDGIWKIGGCLRLRLRLRLS